MAEKISVQIALEGGREVARQLEGIGEAGQKAFDDIAKSAEQVGGFKNLSTEEVTGKLRTLGVEGTAAFDKIQQAVKTAARFESLVQGVESVQTALVALGRAAGPVGLAIAAAFQAAAKATIAFSEEIGKISDQAVKVGLSFEQFKQIREELAKVGISARDAGKGLEHFQKQLGAPTSIVFNVLTETGQMIRFVGEESNKAASELPKFIEQLRQMPDGLERTNLAIKMLGQEAGTELIQGLRRAEGSMSDAEAKAYDLQQALKQLNQAWSEFGSVSLAPTLTAGINVATAAIQALNAALQENPWGTFLQAASLALNPIAGLVQQATKAIMELISSVTGITWDAISSGATTAWNLVTSAVQSAGSAIAEFISSLTGISWDTIASGATAAWDAVVSGAQSAGSAIAEFVSSLTGITWDTISSGATAAWDAVTTAIKSAGTAISDFVSKLTTITWDAISSAGVAAWNAVTRAIQDTINKLLEYIGLKEKSGGSGGGGSGTPGNARGGLIGGRGSGTSDSNLAWVSRGEHIMPAHVVRQPGVLAFLEGLRRRGNLPGFAAGGPVDTVTISGSFLEPIDGMIRSLSEVLQQLNSAMTGLREGLDSLYRSHADGMTRVWDTVAEVMVALGDFSRKLAGGARGGLIGGRGTGTSDSNLAWLSRGEYVTPARAVRQPGVLAFLEALRRSGGNLSAVLDGMGRFALGGLVPRPMPAFAGGPTAGGMSNVTINFPGVAPISGLRASEAVVDELRKAAAMAQVRSGGRKPSRYS